MSEAAFQTAIAFILPHEDEYARGHWGDPNHVVTENVSGDSGGLTKYGIDAASHPGVDIANLTELQAVAIYHQQWTSLKLDQLPDKLGVCAMDVYVNGGHAALWLQHGYDVVMPAGFHLNEDGSLGPESVAALNACTQDQVNQIAAVFLTERDARFQGIAADHPQDRQFLAGWLQRDTDLRAALVG